MTDRSRRGRTAANLERESTWSALLAALLGVVTAVVATLSTSRSANHLIWIPITVAILILLAVTVRLATRSVTRQVRIALIGAPGAGKTVYVTSLIEAMQTAGTRIPVGFAPTSETVDRVHDTLAGFARGHWVARTASDYLYLYSARVAVRGASLVTRLRNATEYELQLADAAGEQLAEFVPGQSRWDTKTSYYQYAVKSEVLFLFLDVLALLGLPDESQAKPIGDQVNDLIFVIQDVCEAHGIGPSQQLDTPVAITITKCDLVSDRLGPIENQSAKMENESPDLQRLLAVARSRCRWVEVFTVSSTGPLQDRKAPPPRITPINVEAPLLWALDRRYRVGRRRL